MSNQQVPLPPEAGNEPTRVSQPDYIEIEIPAGEVAPVVVQQSGGVASRDVVECSA